MPFGIGAMLDKLNMDQIPIQCIVHRVDGLPYKAGMGDVTDPFVKLTLLTRDLSKHDTAKTSKKKNAGSNAKFEETLSMKKSHDECIMEISVYDDDTIHDDFIGKHVLDLDALISGTVSRIGSMQRFDLFSKDGKPKGSVYMTIHLDVLRVRAINAIGLPRGQAHDKNDPYAQIVLKSRGKDVEKVRTMTLSNAGSNPNWNQDMYFSKINGADAIEVKIWDDDQLSADDFIASATVQLGSITNVKGPIELPLMKKDGAQQGTIFIEVARTGH